MNAQCIRTRNIHDVYDDCNPKDKWADMQNKSHGPDFRLPKIPACQIKLFGDHPKTKLWDLKKLEKSSITTQGAVE